MLFDSCVARWLIDGPRGPTRIERTLRLYRSEPRLDVLVRVDKPENENKESLSVGFPWAGSGGAFSFDQNIGTVEPARDLVAGAMQDLFYCQSWAHLWAGRWGVTLVCPDAPLLQFGGPRFLQWENRLPFAAAANHMLCHLYHNLLNTDCPVWQEVLETFRFSVFVHVGQQPSAGQRHDLAAAARPLRADYLPVAAPGRRRELPAWRTEPAEVRVLSIRRQAKSVCVLLENSSSRGLTAAVTPGWRVHHAALSGLDGSPTATLELEPNGLTVAVPMAPYQLAVLTLTR